MSTQTGSSDRARTYVDALVSGEAVADLVIDSLDADDIEAVASHPLITWAVLGRQRDRDAAIRLLEHRVQAAFVAGEVDAVIAELETPELRRDAASHPDLEQLLMRAVTGLAWSRPKIALDAYRRYYSGGLSDPETVAVYGVCQRVLAVAPSWRRLDTECGVPVPLGRFMALQWVVSADRLDALIAELRADMTARPQAYLSACDCMAARYEPLLRYIVSLTHRFLPDGLPSLAELEDDERDLLDTAMGEIDAPASRGVGFVHLFGPVLGLGALLSIAGLDIHALGVVGVLGGLSVGYARWAQRGLYSKLVRPLLAEYLADVGTPTGCVVSWLLINRKAVKRIKAYDVAIDTDSSLDVLARLGRMARLRSEPA